MYRNQPQPYAVTKLLLGELNNRDIMTLMCMSMLKWVKLSLLAYQLFDPLFLYINYLRIYRYWQASCITDLRKSLLIHNKPFQKHTKGVIEYETDKVRQ